MTKENKLPASYKNATGEMDFGLTNDYMFHSVFQKNPVALKGLIASVLHLNPSSISDIIITNPIKIGDQIDDKAFILDIEVLLNNNQVINLEMQVENQKNWQDRSLSYACRSFDQLYQGEKYTNTKPVTQISFLNFTPFPDRLEFHATYKFLNVKNHTVYSDKMIFHVIDLTQIELATEEDKVSEIDHWAKLFKATTWEDLNMIAEKNEYMQSASQTMYELSSDELVQRQCRARRDYYKQINTFSHVIEQQVHTIEQQSQTIEQQSETIEQQSETIEQQSETIEQLKKRIAELEAQ